MQEAKFSFKVEGKFKDCNISDLVEVCYEKEQGYITIAGNNSDPVLIPYDAFWEFLNILGIIENVLERWVYEERTKENLDTMYAMTRGMCVPCSPLNSEPCASEDN